MRTFIIDNKKHRYLVSFYTDNKESGRKFNWFIRGEVIDKFNSEIGDLSEFNVICIQSNYKKFNVYKNCKRISTENSTQYINILFNCEKIKEVENITKYFRKEKLTKLDESIV